MAKAAPTTRYGYWIVLSEIIMPKINHVFFSLLALVIALSGCATPTSRGGAAANCIEDNPRYWCLLSYLDMVRGAKYLTKDEYDEKIKQVEASVPVDRTADGIFLAVGLGVATADLMGITAAAVSIGRLAASATSLFLLAPPVTQYGKMELMFALVPVEAAKPEELEALLRNDMEIALKNVFRVTQYSMNREEIPVPPLLFGDPKPTDALRFDSPLCGGTYCYVTNAALDSRTLKKKQYPVPFPRWFSEGSAYRLTTDIMPTVYGKRDGQMKKLTMPPLAKAELIKNLPNYFYYYLPNTTAGVPMMLRGGGELFK